MAFMKRVSAREAYKNYTLASKDVLQQAAEAADKAKLAEVIKLVKILKARKGYAISQAVPIAKRAYRMGVRSIAN